MLLLFLWSVIVHCDAAADDEEAAAESEEIGSPSTTPSTSPTGGASEGGGTSTSTSQKVPGAIVTGQFTFEQSVESETVEVASLTKDNTFVVEETSQTQTDAAGDYKLKIYEEDNLGLNESQTSIYKIFIKENEDHPEISVLVKFKFKTGSTIILNRNIDMLTTVVSKKMKLANLEGQDFSELLVKIEEAVGKEFDITGSDIGEAKGKFAGINIAKLVRFIAKKLGISMEKFLEYFANDILLEGEERKNDGSSNLIKESLKKIRRIAARSKSTISIDGLTGSSIDEINNDLDDLANEIETTGSESNDTGDQSCPHDAKGDPYANSSSATGTVDDPFVICSNVQFYNLTKTAADWGKYFQLAADIDLRDIPADSSGRGKPKERVVMPIGNSEVPFTGSFDGKDFTISHLRFTEDSLASSNTEIGLFGQLDGGALSNLTLKNVSIDAGENGSSIGAVVGKLKAGTVTNVKVKNISLVGKSDIGGFAGISEEGSISRSAIDSIVAIASSDRIGGFIGHNMSSSNLTKNSTISADISGKQEVGGFVGLNDGVIKNSYVRGKAFATTAKLGGFSGKNTESVHDSYAAVELVTGAEERGGFSGEGQDKDFLNCFWDSSLSANTSDIGVSTDVENISGNTTQELKTKATFTAAGWDEEVWEIKDGAYPQLK